MVRGTILQPYFLQVMLGYVNKLEACDTNLTKSGKKYYNDCLKYVIDSYRRGLKNCNIELDEYINTKHLLESKYV